MNKEWVKTLWLLVGLLPSGLGLSSSAFLVWNWRLYWWLNGGCSLLSAVMMLRGSIERKLPWIFVSLLLAGSLFLINLAIGLLTGCARGVFMG
jgi:hypothetical protein